ncbi:MAG: saccharopine dehydrogenase NADP-binding domain-containing protein [Acidimicrobiia bacterium]|nr:saccharopine dehydrogenase NADP-binding domain-containing protein [Acidimicrobiia bacterium]MBP8181984.1 saccharopine dehydrogenase NADP-binding domain-containing protein [Acidimicrobiia bacterium]
MTRIIVFGATGYTGDLTARSLVRQGIRPVLVGRNPARIEALAAELGDLEWGVADVADPASIRRHLSAGDVLISTVGPFLKFGTPAVQAAAEAGAHYFDSTGEGPFIRDVFDRWGPVAAANGAALLPAFGFDFVPGALAAGLALREAPEATDIEIAYFPTDMNTSGGSRASVIRVMLEEGYGFSAGRIAPERPGSHLGRFELNGKRRSAISVPAAEQLSLPQSYPQLQRIRVHLGVPGVGARIVHALSPAAFAALRFRRLREGVVSISDRLLKGSTGGPDELSRSTSTSFAIAQAQSNTGDLLATVTLAGADPYDFTADILAWGARAAADGQLKGVGALGPIAGFGLDPLQDGCARAGLAPVA